MCGQVQGLAVFPKGCSEGPWLQEVMLETCQWEEPGRSHQELEETWEDRAGGPSIPVDKVRATASHMVSCVSNFGADDVDTEAVSPPPGLHPGPRKPAAVLRTLKPLHHSHWPASRCLKASSSRNPHEQSESRAGRPAGDEPTWLAQACPPPPETRKVRACPPPPETRKVRIWFRLNHFTNKSQGGGWGWCGLTHHSRLTQCVKGTVSADYMWWVTRMVCWGRLDSDPEIAVPPACLCSAFIPVDQVE